jgi:hypothetical protein
MLTKSIHILRLSVCILRISDVNIKKNLRKAMTERINALNIARMSAVDQITSL